MARKWLVDAGVKGKVNMDDIEDEIAALGLKSLAKGTRLRPALIHLGNELILRNFVKLSKEGGLDPSDIKFNI